MSTNHRALITRASLLAAASTTLLTSASLAAISYDATVTFDDPLLLSPTQAPGAWYVDRYAPAGFESQVSLGGDNRLRLSIDGDNGVVGRGAPYNSTFYNTHGRKLDLPTGTYAIEAKVYVPASWLTSDARRRSDLWSTGYASSGAVSAYPIIGVANIDGTPVLRYHHIQTGAWVTIPGAPTADTWYTVGFHLEGGSLVYTVNGAAVGSIPTSETVGFKEAMIQGYNFNDPALAPNQISDQDYEAYWDDLSHAAGRAYNTRLATYYPTVQGAIDAAAAGDTIELSSGVFDGTVLVNKDNLTIKAAASASSKPRIQLTESASALGTVQIAPGADGTTIQGLEIIGFDGPMGVEKAAVYFQGAHAGATITGNTITAVGDSALLTEYNQANTFFTITDNLFNGQTFTGTAGGSFGLSAGANQYTTANWPRPAVYMGGNVPPTHVGIFFSGNTVSTVTGDDTNGNGGVLIDATDLVVSGNTFNGTSGGRPGTETLRVRGVNSDVNGNTFASTSSVAINVGGTANNTVGTSDVTGNAFTGAFTVKVANSSAGQLNATLNFWGDASRPTNPDDFLGNVAVLPYYKDAALSEAGPVRVGAVGYGTIQAAINAVTTVNGNTVEVDSGTYAENITLAKDLDIVGASSATTIVTGSGTIFSITSGGSGSSISGIATSGGARGFNLAGVSNVLLENVSSTGNSSFGINFDGTNSGITLRGSSFSNNASSGIKVASAANVSNLAIDACTVNGNAFGIYSADGSAAAYSAAAQLNGITVNNGSTFSNNASKGIFIESMNNGLFDGITVSNSGTGTTGGTGSGIDINLKYAAYSNLTIRNSVVSNCGTNYSFGGGILVKARNDGAYAANPATLGGTVLLEGLRVENCGKVTNGAGIRVGDAVENVSPSNVVIRNSTFSGNNKYAVLNLVTGATVEASLNHWGTPTGPVGASSNGVGGSVNFNPWYGSSDASVPPVLSDLTNGILANTVINTVQPNVPNLYIAPGTTVTVTPAGSLSATNLEVAQGGTLNVNGGSVTIGSSTISGNFTIFNSFGSFNINGNTTFNVSRTLALITDIHIAAGAVVTVNGGGELILDGCVVDSKTPGTPYSINVEDDGLLTIARSVVSDASIDINTEASSVPTNLRSKVYDSRFTNSEIEATASSAVYHNLFDTATNGASNTDASAAFADVDGWGNVTDPSLLKNRFSLDFAPPALADRTWDNGNLFVQTGDAVRFNLNVGTLAPNTITAAEALLGYNSERLILVPGPTAVAPASGWQAVIDNDSVSAPLGLVDSALSLNLSSGNDGIAGPAALGSVNFTAGTAGATVGFFRVQTNGNYMPDGSFMQDTRLTKSSGGIPSFLTAFTANTGELVVDNDAPTISAPAMSGVQTQPTVGSVSVLQPTSNVVIRGQALAPVTLTFTATDAGLAGLDAADATNDLALTANNGAGTILDSDDYTVSATENSGVVTYVVTLNIPAAAGNGTYAISAVVQDRSGNDSAPTSLGSFVIANEVLATVELQGFVGTGPASLRDVTFVATGGASTKTWTKPVSFTSSLGTVVLDDVPAGTTGISAKTAWTQRSKTPVLLSPAGAGAVALTGTDKLNAGDFNNDNVVNTLDYSILRYYWLASVSGTPAAAVADATGDGMITAADYNVLVPNFYTAGDAQ